MFKSLLPTALALGLAAAPNLPLAVRAADDSASTEKTEKKVTLPEDETEAWNQIKATPKRPTPPAAWREERPSPEEQQKWMSEQSEKFVEAAAKDGAFVTHFPKSEHVLAARKNQISNLSMAMMMGKQSVETELTKLINAAAADKAFPENDRVNFRMQKVGMEASRLAEDGDREAAQKAFRDGMVALQKDFPKNEMIYARLMGMAGNDNSEAGKELAKIVASSPDAPEKLRKKAQDIVEGKVFSAEKAVGKPLAIKFTAVDGREVDLAKLKGKVVLVDFWATWCGPCVAEIPHVKEAFEKYHDKGFEIVGISFDREGDKEKLIKFTKDKGMTWPQYFDGKFWENEYGQQFNIHSIPAMWLVGKDGNLADVNAREDLSGKVAKLLEAN
jgi:thiol-disulfide isomerase/thioredoxin